MSHTSGPWKVSHLDGRTCGPSRLLVCDGAEIPQLQAVAIVTLRTGETDANARLIAAAPDLLAALKEAERLMTDADLEDEPHDDEGHRALLAARAAIAKAERA